jgi:putative transposase
MDLTCDSIRDRRKYRILNVLDIYSRKSLGNYVDQSIDGEWVSNFLDELGRKYKLPAMIQVDNGSEFTSKKV